jgi:hypothetical protein
MAQITLDKKDLGSFRDPAGFVFLRNGVIHRQINDSYRNNYEILMGSGLYGVLSKQGSLIPHEEVGCVPGSGESCFRIIRPEPIPFVSYPYEWCFSQLKDAALKTLEIQSTALEHGMVLKDASAFNIQFQGSRPVHIDTLSFEAYREGAPWAAYGQFCRHFLAPLALMSRRDARLGSLFRIHIDGIPLDLCAALLPYSGLLNPGLLMHIYLHARSQTTYSGKAKSAEGLSLNKRALQGMVKSLQATVEGMAWKNPGTEWGGYYKDTNYTENAASTKKKLISGMLARIRPRSCWDLGSNNGLYSRLASDVGIRTVAFDIDHGAVEGNYRVSRSREETDILPLILDLANPSPGLGWSHSERASLLERGPADVCMTLALIHHLAISNNLPFDEISDFFRKACKYLIIEFVPKPDSQVQRLLASRKDIFAGYDEARFTASFSRHFEIQESHAIPDSERRLYLMRNLER